MHYTGQCYRPPIEAKTPLLEVTIGCSHNKCAFCTMYCNTPFRMSDPKDIVTDLAELRIYNYKTERLFLLNGDPFIMNAKKLLKIAELIHMYLPNIKTISCYCSIRDLIGKTNEELSALRLAGYNELYIGLESGYAPAVEMMNKGFTSEDSWRELGRITRVGFSYNALLMTGVAGKGKMSENVEATAKLLNEIKPMRILLLATGVMDGSELAELRDNGIYTEQTEREHIQEEIMLLNSLNMDDDCYFFASHPYDKIPVSDYFRNKNTIIQRLEDGMKKLPDSELDTVWKRGQI